MKTLIKSLTFACICLLLSCNNEDLEIRQGFIRFNFKDSPSSGKTILNSETAYVLLSISKSNGTIVKQMLKLPLIAFGNGFISDPVQLQVGHYSLTEFLILNSDNEVTYACPIEGSDQSQFVNDPLPIAFEVTENETTTVIPQVLAVTGDANPEDFGYVNFGFEIVDPFTNRIQLTLDDKLWVPTYIEQVVFNTHNNFFIITARKTFSEKYESLWILISNFTLQPGIVLPQNVELQMGFNESITTGTYFDSDWGGEQNLKLVEFKITGYDSINKLISGEFSGHLFSPLPSGDSVKIIKEGEFNKLKVSFQ